MSVQKNTLVFDFSVLPVRPDVGKVQRFLEDQIKLQYDEVKSLQLHNTRNCALIEMVCNEIALRYQVDHNLKRVIVCANKRFKIPVYVDCEAVSVRVHDLPPTMSDETISASMMKFGEVISIRNESWKHYFPGIANGVRVLRMNLFRDIPSFITIDTETTMVTYCNQPKICRRCDQPAHPNKKCLESSVTVNIEPQTPSSPKTILFDQSDFPPLDNNKKSSSTSINNKSTSEERQQNDDEWTDVDDNLSHSSTDYNEDTNKRRRSKRNQENELKKVCVDQCSRNTDHEEIVVATPVKEKYVSTKNKIKGFVVRNNKI